MKWIGSRRALIEIWGLVFYELKNKVKLREISKLLLILKYKCSIIGIILFRGNLGKEGVDCEWIQLSMVVNSRNRKIEDGN